MGHAHESPYESKLANELMSKEDGELFIESGAADALAYGRGHIVTPDLVERLKLGLPLNRQHKELAPGSTIPRSNIK